MTPPKPAWDLSFLRWATLVTAGVAVVAAAITWLVAGWAEAAGILAGAALVTAFFCLSALVIAWAGRIDDALTLPAALSTFFVKAIVFFGVIGLVPVDGVPDRLTLAWAVIAGTGVWAGVHIRWVLTRKLFYVTPPEPPPSREDPALHTPGPPPSDPALHTPAPPPSDPALHTPAPPPSDPEKPTTRG